MPQYPNLEKEIAARGIKKRVIAETIGITPRTLSKKLKGEAPLMWLEACKTQERFFPDMELRDLFARDPTEERTA